MTKRGVILIIDIEEELKKAQIKYIQKELELLRLYYNNITDLEFLHILCSYEELIELAIKSDERLLLYKKMYQKCLNYLFEESQNVSLEKDFVGKDFEIIECCKEDDRLPF
ncbi:MAG: hypothetical protein ACERKN_21565 [Velocimicrobium sp.]